MTLKTDTCNSKSKNLRERDDLEDRGIDGRIILNKMLQDLCGSGLASSGSGKGPVIGTVEESNEPCFGLHDERSCLTQQELCFIEFIR
jgi:hypothetical protein